MRILLPVLTFTILASCSKGPSPKEKSDVERLADAAVIEQSIFFHEDDYCQIQLTLNDNLSSLQKEAEEILGFAEKHIDGAGFTDIKVRDEETHKLVERQIKPTDIESVITNAGFEEVPKVFTGYGQSYRVELKDTKAFGKNGFAIFFDYRDNSVEHIWIEYDWENEQSDKEKFAVCLSELGRKWNLLLMDWNQLKLVDLTDSIATKSYLN